MPTVRHQGREAASTRTAVTALVQGGDPGAALDAISWPHKTRELANRFFDSTVWNDFEFRLGDIVIASYAKSGTTWLQQIVGQLIFGARSDIDVATLSPWLDNRRQAPRETLALLEVQRHRRFVKTHLPVDALTFSPKAKYLFVGRDGRDVVWSFYNHHANYNEDFYRRINSLPDPVAPPFQPPPDSIVEYFRDWLDRDGYPFWPFWEHVSSWWRIRRLPNVLLVHYADLKWDLAGEIRRIAAFLKIPLDDELLARVMQRSSFAHMATNATQYAPFKGRFWHGGAKTFFHRGTNGRWRGVLGEDDCIRYEAMAEQRLGRTCARWLGAGRFAAERGRN
jgi:aryl sulfotransferase